MAVKNKKPVDFRQREIETKLSLAGAEIADANDIAAKIADLSKEQEEKLEAAQEDVAEAYELLGE